MQLLLTLRLLSAPLIEDAGVVVVLSFTTVSVWNRRFSMRKFHGVIPGGGSRAPLTSISKRELPVLDLRFSEINSMSMSFNFKR